MAAALGRNVPFNPSIASASVYSPAHVLPADPETAL
jgi:hypothetical protein